MAGRSNHFNLFAAAQFENIAILDLHIRGLRAAELANSGLCAQTLAQQTAGGYVVGMNMGFQ